MAAVMGNVLNEHADDVRFIFRPISLGSQLDKSDLALQAAIAAGAQGHFWEMYDVLFVLNDDWGQLQLDEFRGWLRQEAGKMGLDQRRFSSDLLSDGVAREAADRNAAAAALGNLRLPFLVLNGVPQPIFAMDRESIASAVSLIALSRRQYRQCPPLTIDPSKDYFATLHTEKGDIVVHLLAKQAPLSVNSFMFLAREGWFDGVTFHRVLPGFAAQSGDPSGTGQGHPGYFFDDEFSSLKFDRPGVVGMANSGSGTNGSQFFLTFAPAPHLDGSFTIFGEITEGIEVLEQLTPRDPDATPGLPPGDLLQSVEVEER
jgi:cyclophilin family peptidyl-prolyl cis-trans isomerase